MTPLPVQPAPTPLEAATPAPSAGAAPDGGAFAILLAALLPMALPAHGSLVRLPGEAGLAGGPAPATSPAAAAGAAIPGMTGLSPLLAGASAGSELLPAGPPLGGAASGGMAPPAAAAPPAEGLAQGPPATKAGALPAVPLSATQIPTADAQASATAPLSAALARPAADMPQPRPAPAAAGAPQTRPEPAPDPTSLPQAEARDGRSGASGQVSIAPGHHDGSRAEAGGGVHAAKPVATASEPGEAAGEPARLPAGEVADLPDLAPARLERAAADPMPAAQRSLAAPPVVQVAVQIAAAASRRIERMVVQLEPAALGRVEVRLDFSHDNRVSALIAVDRPETLDLLQRDGRALERSLQDAGLQLDGGGLSFSLRQEQREQERGAASQAALPPRGPSAQSATAEPDPARESRWLGVERILDICV